MFGLLNYYSRLPPSINPPFFLPLSPLLPAFTICFVFFIPRSLLPFSLPNERGGGIVIYIFNNPPFFTIGASCADQVYINKSPVSLVVVGYRIDVKKTFFTFLTFFKKFSEPFSIFFNNVHHNLKILPRTSTRAFKATQTN